MEEWKLIANGFYEVSNHGNVRRSKPGIGTFIGRPVRVIYTAFGYCAVALSYEGSQTRYLVHRLVASAFLGDIPDGFIVNHKDFNRSNNHISNLEIISQKDNMKHYHENKQKIRGPKKPPRELKGKQIGDKHWMRRNPEKILRGEDLKSKLTAAQVLDIKKDRASGMLYKEIVIKYGISIAHVSRIILNKRWGHLA